MSRPALARAFWGGGSTELLDTDVLSAILRPRVPGRVRLELARLGPVHTSAINLAELLYGIGKRRSGKLRRLYETRLLPVLVVLPLDAAVAQEYVALRLTLEALGEPLEDADLMVAAVALTHDLTLVTGNVRHF